MGERISSSEIEANIREERLAEIIMLEGQPHCWDDDWVRDVEKAVREFIDYDSHLRTRKEVTELSPFYKLSFHCVFIANGASPSQQRCFLQVCQLLCKPQFLAFSRDVAVTPVIHALCNYPQIGKRSAFFTDVLNMMMSAFLESYNSMNLILSTITRKMKPKHMLSFVHRFAEVVTRLEDALFFMLRRNMDATCVLEWWTKALITMKGIPLGHLIRTYTLEMFLNDLKKLRRVDFDVETVEKAFVSCFPGSFYKINKTVLFFIRQLTRMVDNVPIPWKGFSPGTFDEKARVQIGLFSYLEKSGIGLFISDLIRSPGIMTTKEGLVNFNMKEFVVRLLQTETFKQLESKGIKWSIQDIVDSITVDEKNLNLIWLIQNKIDEHGIRTRNRAFMTIVHLVNEQISENRHEKIRQELEKLDDEVSSNWMRRNSMHLLSLICYKEEVFNALEKACPDLIRSLMFCRDVHGTTPYLLACACKNTTARTFFLRQGAKPGEIDSFGNTDAVLFDHRYLFWVEKKTKKSFVSLNQIEYDIPEREVGIQYVKDLFELMTEEMMRSHSVLEATTEIVGSVREQTKIEQMDEYDVQIHFKQLSARVKSFDRETFGILFDHTGDSSGLISENGIIDVMALLSVIRENMQKTLTKMNHSCLPLRIVDLDDPMLMIYEGAGKSKGMLISFDIVPVVEIPEALVGEDLPDQIKNRQGQILKDPLKHPLRAFLKRSKLDSTKFQATYAGSERDVMACLPVPTRLGVVMVKSLLRQEDECAITSYMVKTALFYVLDEKIKKGEMSKLEKPTNSDQWITSQTAKEFEEEGRQWAIEILTRIKTIKTSFLDEVDINNIDAAATYVDDILEKLDV